MGKLGFVCVGCVLPSAGEICNGKDNNCDGTIDTTGNCPNGYGCKDGACALQCTGGEFPCPLGYKCANNYCIPQRCANVPPCPSGQSCDEATGSCVDDCAGVICGGPNQTCIDGRCVNCYDSDYACQAGQLCLNGLCKPDPCKGVPAPGPVLRERRLRRSLRATKCLAGQRCVAGNCSPIPAAACTARPDSSATRPPSACEPNRCLSTQCPLGEACVSTTEQLRGGSLRHHQLPQHLLDLRRHHRRPRDLHVERTLCSVGHHQRRPARRRRVGLQLCRGRRA